MGESGEVIQDAYRFAPAAPGEAFVYGACCPGWHAAGPHETALDRWIDYMQDQGITRVVCLLPGAELDSSDAILGRYRETFGRSAVMHAPVPDGRLVDEAALHQSVLPFLDDAVADAEPVVVHCLDGLGRTGQVLAAWVVHDRGKAPEAAIEAVTAVGRDPEAHLDADGASSARLRAVLRSLA